MSPVEELNVDLTFNETNLHEKIIQVPMIVTKWADRLIKAKRKLAKLEAEKYRLIKGRTSYYSGRKKHPETGKFCPYIPSSQEIRDTYIPGDTQIQPIVAQIATQKSQVEFYEHAMKQANQIRTPPRKPRSRSSRTGPHSGFHQSTSRRKS